MFRFIVTIALALGCHDAYGNPKYTAEELQRLIAGGDYPLQGYMTDWEKRKVPIEIYNRSPKRSLAPFEGCKIAATEVVSPLKDEYPVVVVSDDESLFQIKRWTTESIITATCSALDLSFIVSRYNYRK